MGFLGDLESYFFHFLKSYFNIWEGKPVFHFKPTIHKSHRTNASQTFSRRRQKSVFQQTNQFYLVGTFGNILYLEFVTAFETATKE